MRIRIPDVCFGDLLPAINNNKITDICWNGNALWVNHVEKGRYRCKKELTDDFIKTFCMKVSNLSSRNFNMIEPFLEAETDTLRICMIHGAVTNTGTSLSIKKLPPVRRMSSKRMIKEGYTSKIILTLFEALVGSHCSFVVAGKAGSGKTELVRYLTKYIPADERMVSIEDDFELRLSRINPEIDIIELKANGKRFDISVAIRAAVMQLSRWLLISELKSKEAPAFLDASQVCSVMTTICADDVREVPNKIAGMVGDSKEKIEAEIFKNLDVCVKVEAIKTDGKIKRQITQLGVLERVGNDNNLTMIFDKGFTGNALPKTFWKRIEESASYEQLELLDFLKPKNKPKKEEAATEAREMTGSLSAKTGDLDKKSAKTSGLSEKLIEDEDEFAPANPNAIRKPVDKKIEMMKKAGEVDRKEEIKLAVEILEYQKTHPDYKIPHEVKTCIKTLLS